MIIFQWVLDKNQVSCLNLMKVGMQRLYLTAGPAHRPTAHRRTQLRVIFVCMGIMGQVNPLLNIAKELSRNRMEANNTLPGDLFGEMATVSMHADKGAFVECTSPKATQHAIANTNRSNIARSAKGIILPARKVLVWLSVR